MVKYENTEYYTIYEIAQGFNNDDPKTKELKELFCKTYNKSHDIYFHYQVIQKKVDIARKHNLIRYITFKSPKTKKIAYYGYSIQDLIDFFSLPEAKHIHSLNTTLEIEVHEISK